MRLSGLALGIVVAAGAPAYADVLLMEAITAAPANSESGVLRPRSGASMSQVRGQFGEPGEMKEAVGEPPISRWIYPAYTVYFENEHVIDVVVHR